MDIHNMMEDLVVQTVDELFDAALQVTTKSWCTCRQCRMDVACFVLNRLKPEYVLSGRGVAYAELDYGLKLQRGADVASLVKEGWAKINSTPRPNHDQFAMESCHDAPEGPVFNIRPIMGRIFNGSNFEPIKDTEVSLLDDNGLVRMMDANWANPYALVMNTTGTFTFWPFPVPASKVGERKRFSFVVNSRPKGFEELSHFLELDTIAEETPVCQFSLQAVHRLQDLYVFPE